MASHLERLAASWALPTDDEDVITRYDMLHKSVEEVHGRPLLASLPLSSDTTEQYGDRYLNVIQDRLALLGYLETGTEDIHDGRPGPTLKAGILNFQEDAGLIGDGWVGEKTWLALQQLVSFEEDIRFERWLDDNNKPLAILRRAAQLRLYTLGCTETKPNLSFEMTSSALAMFKSIALELDLLSEKECEDENVVLRLLLDEDQLVENLSRVAPKPLHSYSDDVYQMLVSLARIELWLVGFDEVRPDGARDERHEIRVRLDRRMVTRTVTHSLITKKAYINRKTDFYTALVEFFQAHEDSFTKDRAKEYAQTYLAHFNEFFKCLQNDQVSDDSAVNTTVIEFVDQDKDNIKRLEAEVQGLGARLFDGLKRIGRFILRALKFIVDKAKSLLRRLVRPFHRMVSQAYQGLRTSISAVTSGLKLYTSRTFRTEQSDIVCGRFGGDGDIDLLLNTQQREAVNHFSTHLVYRSKVFRLGCNLVRHFLSIFQTLVVGFVTGWLAFVRTLISIFTNFRSMIEVVKELHSLSPPSSFY